MTQRTKQSLRKGIRRASASGKNAKAANLSKKYEKAGGNAENANARITKGLVAKDTRKQLRSAIKTGDKKTVRNVSKAVRATNTSEKRKGVAMRIKQKTGYKK
jgi:imidazolonepropionase-like amidohydrolase